VEGVLVAVAWIASPTGACRTLLNDDELAAFFREAEAFGAELPQPVREYQIPVHIPADSRRGRRPPEAARPPPLRR